MALREYELEQEFVDPSSEQDLLLAWSESGSDFDLLGQRLDPALFPACTDQFLAIRKAGPHPVGKTLYWSQQQFETSISHLRLLLHHRLIARLQHRLGELLFDREQSSDVFLQALESSAKMLRESSPSQRGFRARSATELASQNLAMATERIELRRLTGQPVMGIPSGLKRLDHLTNGWFPGLHVLAAGPGAGKTTLALQFAAHAAATGSPVLFVTYENSASNLVLKLLCARSSGSPNDVERGFGDMELLKHTIAENAPWLARLSFIEGDSRLRSSAVEEQMRSLMGPHSQPGLIVFDYLQRAAHGLGYDQLRQNVSLLSGELRDLSLRLNCAVIAISSQNRSSGDYGRGGTAQLDSLKESGDLEYSADTVTLLTVPVEANPVPPTRELELKLAKNRFGSVGSLRVIFRPDTGTFREKF